MKIINCIGGLGNQMFQYAVYRYMKTIDNETFLDINDFKEYDLHNGFEIEKVFNIKINQAKYNDIKKLKVFKRQYFKKLLRKINKRLIAHKIIKPYEFDQKIFEMNNVYIEGYFQNIKYIKLIEKQLRKDFHINLNILDEYNKKMINEIILNKNTVSIHVRRGDYIENKKAFEIYGGICEKEYYQEAIKIIEKKVVNPKFYVFSNDITWVKENLNLSNCIYVDWNKGIDSYKDLILMSKCENNIIANSTFSWWGAWLNDNKQKIVIMPRKWTNYSNNELIYENTILI